MPEPEPEPELELAAAPSRPTQQADPAGRAAAAPAPSRPTRPGLYERERERMAARAARGRVLREEAAEAELQGVTFLPALGPADTLQLRHHRRVVAERKLVAREAQGARAKKGRWPVLETAPHNRHRRVAGAPPFSRAPRFSGTSSRLVPQLQPRRTGAAPRVSPRDFALRRQEALRRGRALRLRHRGCPDRPAAHPVGHAPEDDDEEDYEEDYEDEDHYEEDYE
jgi:hypothetical protein